MKKLLLTLFLSLMTATGAMGAGAGFPIEKAPDLQHRMDALQSGAQLFVNYCLNCHSAQAMRYNAMQKIGLTPEQIEKNFLFTGGRVGDLMKIAMRPADAKRWLGAAPPDLSVITRSRSGAGYSGSDYVYTYMLTYYRDAATATGWNNLVFPSVGMPHVLWNRQGPRTLEVTQVHQVEKEGQTVWLQEVTKHDELGLSSTQQTVLPDYKGHGEYNVVFTPLNQQKSEQYQTEVANLTAFLTFMGDPSASTRKTIGIFVLAWLALLIVVAWRLNASFWRDVK